MAEYLEKIVRNDGYQCGPEYHVQNSSNFSENELETPASIGKSSTTHPHPPTMVPNEDYTSELIVASFDLDMTQSVCGYPHLSDITSQDLKNLIYLKGIGFLFCSSIDLGVQRFA